MFSALFQEVDEDHDGHICFREFLLIFRKAAAGELSEDSGLSVLAKQCEINVEEVGVGGAKDFFEAKVRLTSVRLTWSETPGLRELGLLLLLVLVVSCILLFESSLLNGYFTSWKSMNVFFEPPEIY